MPPCQHPAPTAHPRDIGDDAVAAMAARTPHAIELELLVASARTRLGFFPAHTPRALEYPWLLSQLDSDLSGQRILDIGAGLNPLPFVLAARGAQVVTVDSHPLVRSGAPAPDWNEWGFLDYAAIDPRIASHHVAYEDFGDDEYFDTIYSISVIEHLPAATRRRWLARCANQLRAGGCLLLTVDLVPETERLWNLSEGVVVEQPGVHGCLADLVDELAGTGFAVESRDVERAIADSRVDLGLIAARLSG